jgi:hypothetical protein
VNFALKLLAEHRSDQKRGQSKGEYASSSYSIILGTGISRIFGYFGIQLCRNHEYTEGFSLGDNNQQNYQDYDGVLCYYIIYILFGFFSLIIFAGEENFSACNVKGQGTHSKLTKNLFP